MNEWNNSRLVSVLKRLTVKYQVASTFSNYCSLSGGLAKSVFVLLELIKLNKFKALQQQKL